MLLVTETIIFKSWNTSQDEVLATFISSGYALGEGDNDVTIQDIQLT